MSTIKSKPRKGGRNAQTTAGNETPVAEVLTLSEAASYLRVSDADVIHMVETQGLPGRQFGESWRFFKPALQLWLGSPLRNKGLLSLTGAAKDDPYLDEMLKDIYARRERPETEQT